MGLIDEEEVEVDNSLALPRTLRWLQLDLSFRTKDLPNLCWARGAALILLQQSQIILHIDILLEEHGKKKLYSQ